MRKKAYILFALFIFTSLCSYSQEEKEISDIAFEKAVFYDIFPSIIDSIYFETRLHLPPPPPPGFFYSNEEYKSDSNKAIKDYRNTKEYKTYMAKYEQKKDALNKDTSAIFLVVYDSICRFEKKDIDELSKHFKIQTTIQINPELKYRIDLNKLITNNEKFKFKYRSQFPKGREFWRTEYDYFIAASVGFNRIIFDQTRTYGVLNAGYSIGILNGRGYRIFIKKNKSGKWVIDSIEDTWYS
ncbi:hypothetical protein [Formosa sp. S-31]|uniref:hypothetical protein n=1 Tax=Formosa sp. S-31 TaxID=2790949 RepID=UPI003EC0DE04